MVDKPGWQRLEIEVADAVRAYNHSGFLLIESVDNLLQGPVSRVEVVRVELYGEASAVDRVDGYIPASANAKVVTLGNDMDKARIILVLVENGCCRVSGVVVDNDDIELECCLLCQR